VDELVTDGVGLLIAAVVVALLARRLQLPYTVGLVGIGTVLALTRTAGGFRLTHNLIFEVILPALLFEASININWRELARDGVPVLAFAVFGTLISAVVVAAGMMFALGWPARPAVLFGVLIAATDPVAVVAMFKDNGIGGRIRLLTESESLFNDGVAAVLFLVALGWAQGTGGVSAGFVVGTLGLTVGGGILAGLVCAAAALLVTGQTSDHLVEGTLTAVAAYGSFLLAQHIGGSGVLATITAGLVIGNFGILASDDLSRISAPGREFALGLWEFIAFIANSVIFLLIGVTVAQIPFGALGLAALAVCVGLVLLARALAVYPLGWCLGRSRWEVSLREQHVLWWGGLRGALGLALALSLPAEMAFHDEILVATFAVVCFSVVFQGLTMPILLRRLGFLGGEEVGFGE
jgi:CPA1 family monovalent cation:H+ antiporter